ncbi:MAG: hypothetical protein GY874_20890 [Desulfobacteraceae bacterium]|nr:hypothetical protein [Desulfobacteraceae bacterium]
MNDSRTTANNGPPMHHMPPAVKPAGEIIPRPPEKASPEILNAARVSASALTQRVLEAPDDLNVLAELTRIGQDAQNKVNGFFEMRKATVSEMMNKVSDGSHNPLPNQIKQMRGLMDKFDPRPFKEQVKVSQQYSSKGFKNSIIRKMRGIPLMGDLLGKVADKFRPISDEIDGLLMAMDGGLVRLDENNAAIMTQSEELKKLIIDMELKAYEAELVLEALKQRHQSAPEEHKQKIMNAMSRVSKRALFLRGNEQIFLQVLTGLRTSVTTNFELRDTVSMMRDQASPILTNLYALIVVQQEARQIAEAASATQEMVTDLLQAGAEMTRDNVEYVGNLGLKMISEMDKLIDSKNTFLDAIAKADQIAEQTVSAAAKSIPVLHQASAELKKAVADQAGADALLS